MIEFWLQTRNYGEFRYHSRYVTIGREQACDLVLPDASVKPIHAAFFERHDRLFLEKKDPYALTFLNGSPTGSSEIEVFHGDVFDIGPYSFRLVSHELKRRGSGAFVRRESFAELGTPSDATIIKTRNWDEVLPSRQPRESVDDTTHTFTR